MIYILLAPVFLMAILMSLALGVLFTALLVAIYDLVREIFR